MTSDDRIDSYLTARSAQIDLLHADLERITTRARARRNRRRATRGGIAAALLLGGVALVAGRPDDAEPVTQLAGAVVVPSDLEWTVVPTPAGLGTSNPIVTDDGTVYALSTAANPDTSQAPRERVLYRSADGGAWEPVGLPDGLFASSVATDDGALYALGTTAAGGSTGSLDLAASTDGGGSWDTTEVPFDPAAEAPGFPGTVHVTGAQVAVDGDRTVVVVNVQGNVDVGELLDPDDDPDEWYPVGTGLDRAPVCPPEAEGGASDPGSAGDTVPPTTAAPSAVEEDGDPAAADAGVGPDGVAGGCDLSDAEVEHRSWAELGVDPSVGDLVTGYAVVLAGLTGDPLTRVEDMPGAYANIGQRSLVAAEDGFWLTGHPVTDGVVADTATAWHSADGTDWTPFGLPGSDQVVSLGVVDGRAVALAWASGAAKIHLLGSGGTTVDLARLLDLPVDSSFVTGWGSGPMGLALVLQRDAGRAQVVTSSDGVAYSVQDVPLDEMAGAGERATVNGVTVTPDAVKVRVNVWASDDLSGGAPLSQQLYVGTPA